MCTKANSKEPTELTTVQVWEARGQRCHLLWEHRDHARLTVTVLEETFLAVEGMEETGRDSFEWLRRALTVGEDPASGSAVGKVSKRVKTRAEMGQEGHWKESGSDDEDSECPVDMTFA